LDVLGQVQRGQLGPRREERPEARRLELDAARVARPDAVADRQRQIDGERLPVAGVVSPLQGSVSLLERDARDGLTEVLGAILRAGRR
jgi:hypothetical protein